MIKELPNFVHRSNYSQYYLFLDTEIIENKKFNKKLKEFSQYIDGNEVTFELLVPECSKKYIQNSIISIPNSKSKSLDSFYEIYVNQDSNVLYYYFFNFFITDKTKTWEIYCSSTHGIAIAGCCEGVNSLFLELIKPYEKLNAKMKLEEFEFPSNDDVRKKFIETLCLNYEFI
jgi:hypothetical protein